MYLYTNFHVLCQKWSLQTLLASTIQNAFAYKLQRISSHEAVSKTLKVLLVMVETVAMMRIGPPLPLMIFMGKAVTSIIFLPWWSSFIAAASLSKWATISKKRIFLGRRIWCTVLFFEGPWSRDAVSMPIIEMSGSFFRSQCAEDGRRRESPERGI